SLPLIKERILVIILLLHFLSLMLGSVLVLMLPLLVWLTPDLRIKKSLLKCNWTIRKRLPRCKMRLKKRLLAFSRRLHARIRKTRYMHKMRCLLINRRSLLLALRLLWKTPIFPSNSRFPRLCAKCLLRLKRLVSILPMTKSRKGLPRLLLRLPSSSANAESAVWLFSYWRYCKGYFRSEERFSRNAETELVCRLLLEKKKIKSADCIRAFAIPLAGRLSYSSCQHQHQQNDEHQSEKLACDIAPRSAIWPDRQCADH